MEDEDCKVDIDKNGIFAECAVVNKENENVGNNLVAAIATSIYLRQKLNVKVISVCCENIL